MKKEFSFTFLELVVVIVIIGILATIGISQYYPVRERAFGREAVANLRLIAAAESIYRMEFTSYYPGTPPEYNVSNINNFLKLSLTETNWDYNITAATNTTFTATAGRRGSGGTYATCVYTINQTNNISYSGTCLYP